MSEIKVFVADDVNEEKLAPLKDAGFNVVKETKLPPEELALRLKDADGVIVRSATKITAELMDQAEKLRVIGRAGVGVDNIDTAAATERGIVVMNAPDGNTITTAEHTIALMVSMARNVPQASAKLQGGTWDKKSFVGVELHGKTLGVIGLGRIGKHVAKIASGFGMKILGYDPFLSEENANELSIRLGTLEEVISEADFLTIHTPVTDETKGIIGRDAFSKMKKGVRLINCARGGLVDEDALIDAIESGRVAGAALDVYAVEPLVADSPLLNHPKIVTTPHLGASTKEAQEGVALTVAEQMRDYLLSGELRNAVNAPSLAADELEELKPYINLAERMGRFRAQILNEETVSDVTIQYSGNILGKDNSPITRAFISGLLKSVSSRINFVNAMHIAEERGINVVAQEVSGETDQSSEIKTNVKTGENEYVVCGKVFEDLKGRITEVDGFSVEANPEGVLLFSIIRDEPGALGEIGTFLGKNGANIKSFNLGKNAVGAGRLSIIELDWALDGDLLGELQAVPPIVSAHQVIL